MCCTSIHRLQSLHRYLANYYSRIKLPLGFMNKTNPFNLGASFFSDEILLELIRTNVDLLHFVVHFPSMKSHVFRLKRESLPIELIRNCL